MCRWKTPSSARTVPLGFLRARCESTTRSTATALRSCLGERRQERYVIKADPSNPKGICAANVPMKDLLDFEDRGQAGQRELEKYFAG